MDPNCNPIEQQARQDQLDAWYEADGRHAKDHPMHAHYTGLAEKYSGAGTPCSVEAA